MSFARRFEGKNVSCPTFEVSATCWHDKTDHLGLTVRGKGPANERCLECFWVHVSGPLVSRVC